MTNLVDVLLVEDNLGDVRLTQEAFRENRTPARLHVVSDGVEAMKFLRCQDPYSRAPRPQLVLLDLNLPRLSGREVLAQIKSDAELRQIPVIMLTTSASLDDISEAYDLQANSYVAKPVDLDEFLSVVDMIQRYWFQISILPSSVVPKAQIDNKMGSVPMDEGV